MIEVRYANAQGIKHYLGVKATSINDVPVALR